MANRFNGSGCPICLRPGLCDYKDSLQFNHPALAAEWHPVKNGTLTPDMLTSSSNAKVWWQCDMGHEWQATLASRTLNAGRCPFCDPRALRKATPSTCLSATNPALAAEWHPSKNGDLTPDDVLPFSSKKVWWQCAKGHEWEAFIFSRSRGNGCLRCLKKQSAKTSAPLSKQNPALAAQWHPTKNGTRTPDDVPDFSMTKAWWLCEQGHEWEATIFSRSRGTGCPYCTNRKLLVGYNDLATVNPEIAAEWHPTKNGDLVPQAVFPSSNTSVWWQCKEGHEWQTQIFNRTTGSLCPTCEREKRQLRRIELAPRKK